MITPIRGRKQKEINNGSFSLENIRNDNPDKGTETKYKENCTTKEVID